MKFYIKPLKHPNSTLKLDNYNYFEEQQQADIYFSRKENEANNLALVLNHFICFTFEKKVLPRALNTCNYPT